MRERLQWVKTHPRNVINFFIWIIVLAFFGLMIYNTTAVAGNSGRTRDIVEQLVKADTDRERRVSVLIENNNRQTLILCKLILNQGAKLTPEEQAQVEAVCNDRLRVEADINDGTASNTPDNSGNSAAAGVITRSSSNDTPSQTTTQSNNVQSTPAEQPTQPTTPPEQPEEPGVVEEVFCTVTLQLLCQ